MDTHDMEARLRELECTVKDLRARVQVTEDVNEIKEVQ